MGNGPTVSIIGLGNIGQAQAAYLIHHGLEVTGCDPLPSVNESILKHGITVPVETVFHTGTLPRLDIASSIRTAVEGSDVVVVCVPGFLHGRLAKEIGPALVDQTVILQPGVTFGSMEFKQVLRKVNPEHADDIKVVEMQNTGFIARVDPETGVLLVPGIKSKVKVAAYPSSDLESALPGIEIAFPGFEIQKERSIIKTSLENNNAMLHPSVMLANLGRLDNARRFMFYTEGITPSAARIIESMEAEKRPLMEAFGFSLVSLSEWLHEVYGVDGKDVYERARANPGYRNIVAPTTPDNRYLTEDVPYGLVPLAALGRAMGFEMPTTRSVIRLAGVVLGRDFLSEGRNLAALGLCGMTRDELLDAF